MVSKIPYSRKPIKTYPNVLSHSMLLLSQYGSEVWGIEYILKLKTNDTKLLNYNKEFQRVQVTFCKQIIRVHNKSCIARTRTSL